MPRLNIDYSKTIIYKLVCKNLEVTDLYVGSTTDFIKRKNAHKTTCNNEKSKAYNLKVYRMIRENGGFDNWDMIEIEKFECADGNEARARERHFYEELGAKMNIRVPIINDEERIQNQKKYYETHAKELIQKQKKYNAEQKKNKADYCEKQKIYSAYYAEEQAREQFKKTKL
jgi:hypothetical protein